MSDEDSAYYHPEKLGLEPVFEVDYSDGDYQFDLRVIWYHKETKRYYTARDSGCSCPTPFEDYNSLADLEHVNRQVLDEILAEIKREPRGDLDDAEQVEALRRKVKR